MQESKISCFHEGIGVCEQLMGTPIPLSYTRLTSRFLVLWHLTLPIILWDDCHWIVVPATFISAASLFCIEEVHMSFAGINGIYFNYQLLASCFLQTSTFAVCIFNSPPLSFISFLEVNMTVLRTIIIFYFNTFN